MKYAIRFFLTDDEWMYLTEDTGECAELTPVVFDTVEEAEVEASLWRDRPFLENSVKIVEFNEQ